MSGIVYCLVNQAMPDHIKIGKTSNLEQRLRSLDNTSVPLPFECVLALEVEDPERVETLLHQTFHDQRTRSTREFFEVGPQRVIAAMQLTGGRDVTPATLAAEDEESRQAVEKSRSRRERFNFEMVGIPVGADVAFLGCAEHHLHRALTQPRNFRGSRDFNHRRRRRCPRAARHVSTNRRHRVLVLRKRVASRAQAPDGVRGVAHTHSAHGKPNGGEPLGSPPSPC